MYPAVSALSEAAASCVDAFGPQHFVGAEAELALELLGRGAIVRRHLHRDSRIAGQVAHENLTAVRDRS